ncbi:GNAT family N-acetyltransferase [Pseudoduganella violacea]|uniref:Ribosomal protein S18 acetylase RimI-like enzyme n=1 Tax=Pseudoduganella violacea TaxID=1715466 RepID=A0A7W5FT19_9BURK|nr:GNAT family N-acetyltransferase [Pseudoduganella violacea]MBB3118116.1 ribosomal protein S18 acetylase RimI-like enzyme [Pseudoduganella violacea]
MSTIVIRSTTESDWEALKELRLASLLESPTAFGWNYEAAAASGEELWRDNAAGRTPRTYLLAFAGDKAVGLIGYGLSAASECNLIAMWVHPEFRGKEIAAGLVEAVKTGAGAKGHQRIVLTVSPENSRAVALYQKQGFSFLPEWETLESHPHIKVQKMEWRSQECML